MAGWLLSWLVAVGSARPSEFLAASHWDDGQAEFQAYRARVTRYGIPREARATLILVKEPFRTDRMVKAGHADAADTEVLKLNLLRDVPTGIYTYHEMASFFFERRTGRLLKVAMSSQDGCGTTYLRYQDAAGQRAFTWHSYFDDEGEQTVPWDGPAPVFYDALPLVLRFRLPETSYTLSVLPSILSSRRPTLEVAEAEVRRVGETTLPMEGGADRPAVLVEVTRAGRSDRFYFDPDMPHTLLRWEAADGDRLSLHRDLRLYYWEHTDPEDERLLGEVE